MAVQWAFQKGSGELLRPVASARFMSLPLHGASLWVLPLSVWFTATVQPSCVHRHPFKGRRPDSPIKEIKGPLAARLPWQGEGIWESDQRQPPSRSTILSAGLEEGRLGDGCWWAGRGRRGSPLWIKEVYLSACFSRFHHFFVSNSFYGDLSTHIVD